MIEAAAFPSDQCATARHIRHHGLDPKECLIEITKSDDLEPAVENYGVLPSDHIIAQIDKHKDELALDMLRWASGRCCPPSLLIRPPPPPPPARAPLTNPGRSCVAGVVLPRLPRVVCDTGCMSTASGPSLPRVLPPISVPCLWLLPPLPLPAALASRAFPWRDPSRPPVHSVLHAGWLRRVTREGRTRAPKPVDRRDGWRHLWRPASTTPTLHTTT